MRVVMWVLGVLLGALVVLGGAAIVGSVGEGAWVSAVGWVLFTGACGWGAVAAFRLGMAR